MSSVPTDRELVPPGSECPQCHEADMDRLVWIDDDTVECQTSQHRYQQMGPAKPAE